MESLKELDLFEPIGHSRGLYHITIKGEYSCLCRSKLYLYETVGGNIVSSDNKYVYFIEPKYGSTGDFINKYLKSQVCKKCLKSYEEHFKRT